MNMNKVQHARLLYIDRKIRAGNFPSAGDMAGEYEVSRRTIQRDLEYMRDFLHAPLEYDESRRGWNYTENNYFLPALDISESDFFAICISEKALQFYANTPLYEKLSAVYEKLKSFIPENMRVHTSWIDTHYTFLQESHTMIDPAIWETLSQGLRLQRKVRIEHRKAGSAESSKRTVDPYHIVNYRGEWYLIALCHEKKEVRRFAVSRIGDAALMKENFTIPGSFDYDDFMKNSFGIMTEDRQFMIKIRFSREQAPYVLERTWHREQTVTENMDGTADITFPAASLFEVKRWVLSWGPHAEVLEPVELRDLVAAEIEGMRRIYQ